MVAARWLSSLACAGKSGRGVRLASYFYLALLSPLSPSPSPLLRWVVALDSDWADFGGYERVSRDTVYHASQDAWNGRPASLQVYSPCRTALVLKLKGK
jgi:hypothetical protein